MSSNDEEQLNCLIDKITNGPDNYQFEAAIRLHEEMESIIKNSFNQFQEDLPASTAANEVWKKMERLTEDDSYESQNPESGNSVQPLQIGVTKETRFNPFSADM
jgi:hypothetical protein